MATLISSLLTALASGHSSCSRLFYRKPLAAPLSSAAAAAQSSPPPFRASSAAAAVVEINQEPIAVKKEAATSKSGLACPICYNPLTGNRDSDLSVGSASKPPLQCNTCKKTYYGNETHLDLTVASGAKNYGETLPASTEIFRTRLVSFLYERGWRQNFVWGGFPGVEKEFELAMEYLRPVLGGNIIDASCGSGLFSRLFAKSGLFSRVIAMDFSENMLRQCYEFVKEDESIPKEDLLLVRADISRLPFVSSSTDAVHAGAALHCWPSPSAAVAEISRVLRPGGVFVATTFIFDGPLSLLPFLRRFRENARRFSGTHVSLSESELEDLCTACGLVRFTCLRNGRFVMISATKPS